MTRANLLRLDRCHEELQEAAFDLWQLDTMFVACVNRWITEIGRRVK